MNIILRTTRRGLETESSGILANKRFHGVEFTHEAQESVVRRVIKFYLYGGKELKELPLTRAIFTPYLIHELTLLCPDIRELAIKESSELSDKSLRLIALSFPRLTAIGLQFAFHSEFRGYVETPVTEDGVIDFLQRMQSLRKIDFTVGPTITGVCFASMPSALTSLAIDSDGPDHSYQFNGVLIQTLMGSQLPHLEFLKLEGWLQLECLGRICQMFNTLTTAQINVENWSQPPEGSGGFSVMGQMKTLREITISRKGPTDLDFEDRSLAEIIKECNLLEGIDYLSHLKVMDSALVDVAASGLIKSVALTIADLTDAGLMSLSKAPRLSKITLKVKDEVRFSENGVLLVMRSCQMLSVFHLHIVGEGQFERLFTSRTLDLIKAGSRERVDLRFTLLFHKTSTQTYPSPETLPENVLLCLSDLEKGHTFKHPENIKGLGFYYNVDKM